MAVYDDQKTKPDRIEDDELRALTGISDSEESSIEDKAFSGASEDIAEANKLGDKDNDFVNNTSKKSSSAGSKIGGWIGKRSNQYIAGAIAALLTAVIASFITFMPTFVVNHLNEMLKSIGNVQIEAQKRYRRKYVHKAGDILTRDGRRSGKILAELERKGYRPVYAADGKTIRHFTRYGAGAFDPSELIYNQLEVKHPMRSSRWKTKGMNAFYERYNVPRRSVVLAASTSLDESIETIINQRMARITLDDEPTKVTSDGERSVDGETPEERVAREERNARAKALIESDGSLDELRTKIKNGTPLRELTNDERAILRVGIEFDDDLIRLLNNFPSDVGVGKRLVGSVRSVAGSAVMEIADKICTVKTVTNSAKYAARIYRLRSLMQYASIFKAVGDQTRIGKVDSRAMNEVMTRVMKEDSKGRGIGASNGFKALMSGGFSKSNNDLIRGNYSVDGKLTGISGRMNDLTDGMTGCSFVQNPVAQIGVAIGEGALGLATGGGGKAALKVGGEAAERGIRVGMRQFAENAIKSLATKRTAAGVATVITVELTFEGMMNYLQIQAEKSLALNTTGQEVGGDAGDLMAAGAGGMNKQRSFKAGMIPATTEDYTAALNDYKELRLKERQSQSLYARLFDYNNHDSLIFKTASLAVTSPGLGSDIGTTTSNLAMNLLATPLSVLSKSANLVSSSTYAQDSDKIEFDSYRIEGKDIELATDFAGNVQAIMPSYIENIDPEENIKSLILSDDIESSEPYQIKSERFKNHVKNCVESEDSLTIIEEYGKTSDPEYDCLATSPLTRQFKAHLAFQDMVDGIDASLFPEEITNDGQQESSQRSNENAILPVDGLPWPLGQTKAQAKATQGNCVNESTQSVCHGGHPYLSHDLFAPPGTPVFSVSGGEVISARVGTCGHGHGRAFSVQVYDSSSNITYFYQHLDADAGGVSRGTTVNPGDRLGVVGPTGAACGTPPHLHIDAGNGRGRQPCSRRSCSNSVRSNFVDMSRALYKGYDVLN